MFWFFVPAPEIENARTRPGAATCRGRAKKHGAAMNTEKPQQLG
jgi:hypothetical protein